MKLTNSLSDKLSRQHPTVTITHNTSRLATYITKMTRPQRQHGAARQLGAINKILKAQPGAHHENRSSTCCPHTAREEEQTQIHHAHAGKVQTNHRQDNARQAARKTAKEPRPTQRLQDRMSRIEQSGESQRSDHSSLSSRSRDVKRRSHSPGQERRGPSSSQRQVQKPVQNRSNLTAPPEAVGKIDSAAEPASGNHKRLDGEDGDGGGRNKDGKRHQSNRPEKMRTVRPNRRKTISQSSCATEVDAASTTVMVKSKGKSVQDAERQLPSPASSDATPKRERQLEHQRPSIDMSKGTPTTLQDERMSITRRNDVSIRTTREPQQVNSLRPILQTSGASLPEDKRRCPAQLQTRHLRIPKKGKETMQKTPNKLTNDRASPTRTLHRL